MTGETMDEAKCHICGRQLKTFYVCDGSKLEIGGCTMVKEKQGHTATPWTKGETMRQVLKSIVSVLLVVLFVPLIPFICAAIGLMFLVMGAVVVLIEVYDGIDTRIWGNKP